MSVEIEIPDFADAFMAAVQQRIDAALAVGNEVETIIKEKVLLDGKDVDGNDFAQKQPRPPKTPTNFPTVPLIQNDNPNLMAKDRWQVERVAEDEVVVTYTPPAHHQYLVTKPAANGGRKWLTDTEINAEARGEIERRMREAFEG